MNEEENTKGRYALVNGLNLYHEIHGEGFPLVLLHGGGSTIESNYGKIIPALAKKHKVVAIELQAHGHTPDRDQPLSFEQDADDVSALLHHLNIEKANIMGFSNGGTTALQMGIRHPEQVNKLVLVAAAYKREGMLPGFFDMMKQTTIDEMPQPLKDAYREANPDEKGLQAMFERDVARMVGFVNIQDEKIASVRAPALVINGDRDVVQTAHALEMSQLLQDARLAVLPGEHGECIGEICSRHKESHLPAMVAELVTEFLKD